ncbi:hypothetical protein HDE_06607 [Halotydeus destructor]|nr:hypothetical protein HDE_06607 [Halotydeus destructor]
MFFAKNLAIRVLKLDKLDHEKTADKIAQSLQYFLLIDADQFLHKKQRSKFEVTKWNFYRAAMILFHVLCMLRFLLIEQIKEKWFRDAWGDFYRYYGGVESAYNYASIFYTSLGLTMCCFTCLYAMSHKGQGVIRLFLVPLDAMADRRNMADIGLTQTSIDALRFRAHVVYYICYNVVTSFTAMFLMYVPYLYIRNYDLTEYWANCIFAYIWYHAWVFANIATLCVSLGYFYLLCSLLLIRAKDIDSQMTKSLTKVQEPTDLRKLFRLVQRVNDLCETLAKYDQYWCMYIYSAFQCFLPLMSLMLYISFIPEHDSRVLQVIFVNLLIQFGALLSFTCFSASAISKEIYSSRKKLIRFALLRLDGFTWTKLRRTLTRYEAIKPIGFTCANFFVVNYDTYVRLLLEILVNFFLLLGVFVR